MKIKYKEERTVMFAHIMVGDCFKFCDDLFIKIRNSSYNDNAFNVRTEKVVTIRQDADVIPINMTLVEG